MNTCSTRVQIYTRSAIYWRSNTLFCLINDTSTSNIIQLIEATGNNQLKELFVLIKSDYDKLPPNVKEHYKQLLKSCWSFQLCSTYNIINTYFALISRF